MADIPMNPAGVSLLDNRMQACAAYGYEWLTIL